MQPLRIIIPGGYWDSQIYAGRLYLFEDEGSIRTLNWDQIVEEWDVEEHLRLAMRCAFGQGDYLYGNRWDLFFSDAQVKRLLQEKFESLATHTLELSQSRFEETTIGIQEVPFPFPHSDSTIYKRNLYVASTSGVFRASCHKSGLRYPVSTRPEKKWDAPIVAVSAYYDSLALAAGDEGLWELPINGDNWLHEDSSEARPLSLQNCQDCSWAFYSIYGSSHVGNSYLAAFTREEDDQQAEYKTSERGGSLDQVFRRRKFDRLLADEQIFRHEGYSWGAQDKLCQVVDGSIQVVRYEPWKEATEQLTDIGTLQLAEWKGDVVSGGVALFGTIAELENAIVVVPSQGQPITLAGEPVNWRVFPRSVHYKNQLHVIYEDRLEILSFNHDYFVAQQAKLSGITYRWFT